jgi:NAD(P)-dependent dehydrogenase (short-subunit alcohol dehydrogenase family)
VSADWILILGASSGFGGASAKAFARAGYNVLGVHLDRSATLPQAKAIQQAVRESGRSCHFFNVNAADEEKRIATLASVAAILEKEGGKIRVLLHSLAFGSLMPLVPMGSEKALRAKQMTMTLEVMGHSLVWWTRDCVQAELMGAGGRVFAMTSSGSRTAFHAYGAVGAAKAALESHVRYLAMELAPRKITVNAILAGVTDTPALHKIPGADQLLTGAQARNPSGRLTEVEDVADCLVELARPGTHWLTGNVLQVDGGENICA